MTLELTPERGERSLSAVQTQPLVDLTDRGLTKLGSEKNTASAETKYLSFGDDDIYSAKDNLGLKKTEVLVGLFPNDKPGDQLNYVRAKVKDIMEVDRFKDFTGASFGWADKAARAENVMNDTANVSFKSETERRSYLNTVAADFNRRYGGLSVAESRVASEIHGHPHASVNGKGEIDVYLVDGNGKRATYNRY